MKIDTNLTLVLVLATLGIAVVGRLSAQPPQAVAPPPPPAASPTPPQQRARPAAYPTRPQAPQDVLARGRSLYGVNCNFCHGSDARGGEGGPNLLRSELVLNDKDGELIAPVIINGRVDQGMPKFNMTRAQISDVAAYIHDFKVGGYDISRNTPDTILVGDAKAGEEYFAGKCASCHSATGDMKGIATKISDPKLLQNWFLMPGGGGRGGGRGGPASGVPPTTISVTMASGKKVDGRLGRIDDFSVSVILADGTERTLRLDANTKVEIHDPLQPHKDLLAVYTDKDIHNLTSYLVTLK